MPHLQARGLREADPGAYTAGQDDEVRIEGVAVGEFDGPHGLGLAAQAAYPALRVDLDAQCFQVAAQQLARGRVEVALHEVFALLGQYDLGGRVPRARGPPRRRGAAADDDGAGAGAYGGGECQAVVQRTEGMDTVGEFGAEAAQRRQDRVRTGRQDQCAVRDDAAVVALHHALGAVDADHPHPAPHRSPGQRDDVGAVAPGEDLGEQHPVVRGVLLLADDGDRRRGFPRRSCRPGRREWPAGQLPGQSGTRRPAADHHDVLAHDRSLRGRCYPAASRLFPVGNTALSAPRPAL